MPKWQSEPIEGDPIYRAGATGSISIHANESMKIAIPLSDGLVLSREQWAAIRTKIDQFYHRAYDEAESVVTIQTGESVDTVEYINRLRVLRMRRIVEECSGGGYVYFLRGDGYCKIGQTTNLEQRLNTLKIQLPFKVDLFHAIPTATPSVLEKQFHARFKDKRANGEWFKLESEDFEYIKTWTRAVTPIDAAIEANQELVGLKVVRDLISHGVAMRLTPALGVAVGDEQDDAEGWSEYVGRFSDEVTAIYSGQACFDCGAEVYALDCYQEMLEAWGERAQARGTAESAEGDK